VTLQVDQAAGTVALTVVSGTTTVLALTAVEVTITAMYVAVMAQPGDRTGGRQGARTGRYWSPPKAGQAFSSH